MAQLFHLSSSNVSDTFHKLVQTEGGSLSDGSGSIITFLNVTASYAVSASHEVTTEISSSYATSASFAVSTSHADTAVNLDGLNSTESTITFLNGISDPQTEYILAMDQHLASAATPTFRNLQISNLAYGDHIASVLLPTNATTLSPHFRTMAGGGAFNIGDRNAAHLVMFVNKTGDAFTIDHDGKYSGTVGSAETASIIKVVNNSSTDEENAITFLPNGTGSGNVALEADSDLMYNPSIKRLSTSQFAATNFTASGNISASGTITANSLVGHLSTADQTNITSVGTLGSLTVTNNINANGNIVGDGATQLSGLTHISAVGNMNVGNHWSDYHTITGQTEFAGHVTASGHISASGNIMAGAVGTMSAYTGSFGQVSASGNIITTGNVIADNIIIGDGGYIRPATAGGDITFSPYSHGSQELLLMNADTFDVKMDAKLALGITPTTFNVNGGHNPGHQFKVDHTDGQLAIYTEADTSRLKLRGLTSIILSGSATSPNADVFSPYLTKTALLVSGSQANIGDLSIAGHVTASGNISSSGAIKADSFNVDGYLALNTDGSTQGRVFPSQGITNIQIGRNGSTNRNIELLGPVTASGNISASGNLISRRLLIGDSEVAVPDASFQIRNQGSTNAILESLGNGNQLITFKNNQSPDFTIGNYFGDAGFQIKQVNGPAKTMLTIGANDGDEIEVSGSLKVTSHVSASGGPGADYLVRPNLYWFAVSDEAVTSANTSLGDFPDTDVSVVSFDATTLTSHSSIFSLTNDVVTISRAGIYKFTYNILLEITGGSNRTEGAVGILRTPSDDSVGLIDGSRTSTYNRLNSGGASRGSGTVSMLIDVAVNDAFYIGFYKEVHTNSNTKMVSVPSGCTWMIESVT